MKNSMILLCTICLVLMSISYAEEINKVLLQDCSTQNTKNCALKKEEMSDFSGLKPSVHKNRVKRYLIRVGKCSIGKIFYIYRCWSCDEYRELTGKPC
ncbi:unnamed protein product [Arctia plantaginis]|uniref:Secreted protein n=1 Tax=Arctia plantaginis TaxID=874455 RepID=A0A8S1BWK6_ARCPL|nr:unnamed protein product [Arctia plantaginis]